MTPEEFSSPEEKLLKLIRGEKNPRNKAPAEKSAHLSDAPKPAAVTKQRDSSFHLTPVNTALIAVLVVLAAFLLFDFINFSLKKPVYLRQVPLQTAADPKPIRESKKPFQSQNSYEASEDYSALASRDLFKAPSAVYKEHSAQGAFDKSRELSLKGIIAGENPQAIIEDEKNKKTYFLFRGESVSDIAVEEIQPDRVILKVSGEILELTL